ncbi:hypothetical protein GALMADRAFT_142208 [Galerina marginata CBS 339.88]|uniref:Uncharacterized protein n=1 Tax=Galerina marginata (strain CBS 339.88) TaxID=685588 RepID=A0A067SUL5_GALM3|nr:hypothetical protein GALMADRAFT_142208 [Galerina marginata CBS 339.88]
MAADAGQLEELQALVGQVPSTNQSTTEDAHDRDEPPVSTLASVNRRGKGGGGRTPARTSKKKKSKTLVITSDDEERQNDEIALDADDSMFKSSSVSTRVERSVSPVRTRSASGVVRKRKLMDAVDDEVDTVEKTTLPVRKPRKASKKSSDLPMAKDSSAVDMAMIERLIAIHRALDGLPGGSPMAAIAPPVDASKTEGVGDDMEDDADDHHSENEYDLNDPFIDDSEAIDRPVSNNTTRLPNPFIDDAAIEDVTADEVDETPIKSNNVKGKMRRPPSPEWDMSAFYHHDEKESSYKTIGEEEEARQLQRAMKESLSTPPQTGRNLPSTSRETLEGSSASIVDPTPDIGGVLNFLPGLNKDTLQALIDALAQQLQSKSVPLGKTASTKLDKGQRDLLPSPVIDAGPASGSSSLITRSNDISNKRPTFGLVTSSSDNPSTPRPPVTTDSSSPIVPTTDPNTPGRRTFGQVVTPGSVKKAPISAKDAYRVLSLPTQCEVFNPQLQDALLVEKYVGLPNLKAGAFISWYKTPGPGQIFPSQYGDLIPSLDYISFVKALCFTEHDRFLNPARVSPMVTNARRTNAEGFKMSLCLRDEPAFLVSTIFVKACHLTALSQKGVPRKYISGIGHMQDWDRQVSFLCMAFGHEALHAQLALDALDYSTRGAPKGTIFDADSMTSRSQSSPSIRFDQDSRSNKLSPENMALDYNEDVPIYDARGKYNFDIDIHLPNVHKILPRFDGEVPENSCAVVVYTASVYRHSTSGKWTVSCNI